jgi:hypothetical protein
MRMRWSIGGCFLALALAYLASPYVMLWRLQVAMENGDMQALERMIDWRSVREGLKADISDGIIGPPQTQLAANTLPPFGSGFMTGIADSTVEREVTPQNLVAVMHQMRPDHAAAPSMDCLFSAFFKSPTSFEMVVRGDDEDESDQHLRLRLELRGFHWALVRAWVPQDLVERATQRT